MDDEEIIGHKFDEGYRRPIALRHEMQA